MSREPVDPGLCGAGEVEGARAVVKERRIVDAQRQRDRSVRLVTGRADRVEAPPVLLEPARGVVRLPAVDLRAPDLLHLGRRRPSAALGSSALQRREEMLLERIGSSGHGSTWARRASPYAATGCSSSALHSPAAASAFIRARWTNTACAASTFAASPPHVCSADACSARPYENDSGHGPPSWLIALRFSVASTSD